MSDPAPAPQGEPTVSDTTEQPFTAPQHDFGAAAFDKAHNYEYGRQHNGYSHMGIPPECPACAPAAVAGRDAAGGDR